MSASVFTKEDLNLIKEAWADLKVVARERCENETELKTVQKAFDFANGAHKNVRRRSGEPYMIHPIAVAKIVAEDIGLGYKSICAALLHDVVEDTDYTVEDIRALFGDKIASLVDGLTKIKNVLDNEDKNPDRVSYTASLQAENFKRILLTLNDDVRVALIKLADRLHNCRTIEFMPEYKRDKVLSETMFIFVPLAHRLGLYEIKSEMENIWLKYKEPDAYNDIIAKIAESRNTKDIEIDEFMKPIRDALNEAGFDFEIKKRVKTPYSIWHKMRTKDVTFEQVYDLYAVRIIFTPKPGATETERVQCYHIFSIITGIYRYQPSRVRDWVKHPKNNGYEALHCTLMSNSGVWVEVQIRSKRMDDIAEKGIAAHWAYKKGGYISENESEMDKWLVKVKDILIQKDFNAMELLDIIHSDLVTSDIIVFTPKGDQKTIQKGATALDFAYMIHTRIGYHAIAAKVNMKLVPLSYVLKTGDQVEIITAEKEEPKKEWLQFVQTRNAITHIMNHFKSRRDEFVLEGAKLFREVMSSIGSTVNNENIKKILDFTQITYVDELYFRIGLGMVNTGSFAAIISNSETIAAPDPSTYTISSRDSKGQHYIIASCCSPIPGDAVIGFRSPNGTITVHKKTCPIAEKIASKHGDWVVSPDWDNATGNEAFPVRISLRGLDRVGLLNELTQYISLVMGINMRKLNLGSSEGIFEGYIELMVRDKRILEEMIVKLGTIEGIQSVTRTDI
ncbi:MAG: bifunctional (p)ppGpp synthetase/guanosine-3',5'-bis(diphosphate) 3'-pyrophosphohydrolase [Bacteroidales bacterium]|nr:bifunctional (p)ppGpp synthetase/guanosine-3',5'-bis(diphosphate) 3'-pyrophosphohydrolase [Bacteroidales bacterium]